MSLNSKRTIKLRLLNSLLDSWQSKFLITTVRVSKGEILPYSLPSAGPRADPSVQAVTPQVTFSKSTPVVGCHYFLLGLRSSSQLNNVIVLRPASSYTAWWRRQIGVNNLPKVGSKQFCLGWLLIVPLNTLLVISWTIKPVSHRDQAWIPRKPLHHVIIIWL